jgi:hypothetical protein
MMLTLAQAADEAAVNRTTVFRWIRKGLVSGEKGPDGVWRCDASELHRYLSAIARTPVRPDASHEAAEGSAEGANGHAQPARDDAAHEAAILRVQLDALRELVDSLKRREDDLRQERDAWRAQAERLALPAPMPNGEDELRQERDYWREQAEQLALPVPAPPVERRGLLGWFRRAG